ncbi:hypothetical protein TNCV_1615381 [Trichonephila clavipes]|nr:hypothetical protein TNCV_1615381 [Trichonephila clavipes]
MPSPIQSNCDALNTIANRQYDAVWSMGHTQQKKIKLSLRKRALNKLSQLQKSHMNKRNRRIRQLQNLYIILTEGRKSET